MTSISDEAVPRVIDHVAMPLSGIDELAPSGGGVFDGLVMIGRLVAVQPIKSTKTGNVIAGIANAELECSRGMERLSLQRVLRTALGAFDLEAWPRLTAPSALGLTWLVTVGKEVSGGYTNWVALDAKVLD